MVRIHCGPRRAPLVVIAYEMLTHPGSCPWAQSPWKLPIACMGTATAGVVVVSSMGVGVSSTMCSLTWEADYVSGVYSVYRSVLLRRLRQPISSIG